MIFSFIVAVVSVKPDNTAAAVQAATGQPLLAQSAPQSYVYMIFSLIIAVVSVKPDNTAAAVQAATGQPLLAQSAPQSYVYMIFSLIVAVVSVKPDNTAAAVQAATGQPLLAQSAPQSYVYMPQMPIPQPTGYHPQMGQVRLRLEYIYILLLYKKVCCGACLKTKAPTKKLTF